MPKELGGIGILASRRMNVALSAGYGGSFLGRRSTVAGYSSKIPEGRALAYLRAYGGIPIFEVHPTDKAGDPTEVVLLHWQWGGDPFLARPWLDGALLCRGFLNCLPSTRT